MFEDKSTEERFNKFFGAIDGGGNPAAKEILIGEVLGGNRSRKNREARDRRTKFMK